MAPVGGGVTRGEGLDVMRGGDYWTGQAEIFARQCTVGERCLRAQAVLVVPRECNTDHWSVCLVERLRQ